jgi:CO dehydrogenase/acetyl-CoA synthase beta subunit
VVALLKKFVSKADERFAAVDEQIKLPVQYADVNQFVNDLCNIFAPLKECVMRSEIKHKVRHPDGMVLSLC